MLDVVVDVFRLLDWNAMGDAVLLLLAARVNQALRQAARVIRQRESEVDTGFDDSD